MAKVIAVAFSDLHINLWTKFNSQNKRTLDNLRVLSIVRKICIKKQVPAIFLGDLFHKPESIDNELFDIITSEFNHLNGDWECYAISGNHDMKSNNQVNKLSPSFVKSLSRYVKWLHCIDLKSVNIGKAVLHGVPYIDHNNGIGEYVNQIKLVEGKLNILMLHTDYPGATDTDGSEVGSAENINTNMVRRFSLTLIGHIHKHQRLSRKVYMVGATHQQRRTDKDCEMGYCEIYDDGTVKMVSLSKEFPRFIDVEDESEVKDDGNFYTVIPKKLEVSNETNNEIHIGLSKVTLAKKYMRLKGVKDVDKKKLLIKLIKEAQDD